MSNDWWKRDATEVLINAYKQHPVLYDVRHPGYYNKKIRDYSLEQIVKDVCKKQPKTTMKDVMRKIQNLRTQLGHELAKIRRHAQNGEEYRPTAWWYQRLNFLQHHIIPRMGPKYSIDLSEGDIESWIVWKKGSVSPSALNGADYEHSGEEMMYNSEVCYEEISTIDLTEEDLEPIRSEPATSTAHKRKSQVVRRGNRKVARIVAAPETSPVPPAEPAPTVSVVPEPCMDAMAMPLSLNQLKVSSQDERNKSLGQFVSAQMSFLRDDYIFLKTQLKMLSYITEGLLEQGELDKSVSATADQEMNKKGTEKK